MNKLLGVRIDNVTKENLDKHLSDFLNSKKFNMITPVNPRMLVEARKDTKFKSSLNNSDLNLCDGAGISLMLKLVRRKLKRFPGSTLIYDILKFSENNNKRVFFFGAQPKVNKKLISVVKEKYLNLNVIGYSPAREKRTNERFSKEEQKNIISLIKNFKPEVICIFFGIPFQENWLNDNREELERLGVKLGVPLGRTADFVAGYTSRAPIIWQKLNLEWLYRLIVEKKRFKKVIISVPIFMFFALKDILHNKLYKLD